MISFVCNITGKGTELSNKGFTREGGSADNIRTIVRWRSLIHLLSLKLYGESMVLSSFPTNKNIKGLGMTDAPIYAKLLEEKFSYTNTYFHQEPFLDITNPDPKHYEQYDFIITSDVFEHIEPPIERAFINLKKLLKPEGFVIFTVPWRDDIEETIEHFPQLNDYEVKNDDGKYTLENMTKEGEKEVFDNLVFHGGPGQALEMRVFSKNALIKHFKEAGFKTVEIMDKDVRQFGIILEHEPWSLPIVASL